MVAVADRLDSDEYAALEYQAPHQFARTEVVNILGDNDFSSEVGETRPTPVRIPVLTNMAEVIQGPDCTAKVAHRRRLTATGNNLLLVHAITDKLVSAAEGLGRLSGE